MMRKFIIESIIIYIAALIASCWESRVSRWRELADLYGTKERHHCSKWIWQTGSINKVGYRNSLNIDVLDEGIYLSTTYGKLINPFFHPPLLIPWDAIVKAFPKKRVRKYYWLLVETPTRTIEIELPREALQDAETILESKSPYKFYFKSRT